MRRWFIAILMLAGLAAVVLSFGELRAFTALLERVRPWLLGFALLFQLATYAVVAAAWGEVLKAAGSPRPFRVLAPLSIAKLFADQAVPTAGISGNLLLVDQLIAMGVPRGHAVTALILSILGYYAAFSLLSILMLVSLWFHNDATTLLAGAVTLFLVIAFGIAGGVLLLVRKDARLPRPLQRIGALSKLAELLGEAPRHLLRDRRLFARVTVLNALVFLADAATLWVVLAALGAPAPFSTAFAALLMAQIATILGPTPLGLGSFEATSIAMLRMLQVPLEAAVAATFLLRGLTLWLPMIPGLLVTRRMLKAMPKSQNTVAGAPRR